MTLLAIETSGKACSATVLRDGKDYTVFTPSAGTHSAALFPHLEKAMRHAGISPSGLDAVAVSAGPGSFTGIRIGIAAAKGIAWAAELPAIGISSLEASAWTVDADGHAASLISARHGNFYFALFSLVNGCCTRLTPDEVLPAAEILKMLPAHCVLTGEGAAEFMSYTTQTDLVLSDKPATSLGVARAALARGTDAFLSARDLEAVYLRPSQAERTRAESINGKTTV